MGPIAHLGRTEMLRREIERLQPHLGVTEIPIGETDLPRVCSSGYDIKNSVAPDIKNRCGRV